MMFFCMMVAVGFMLAACDALRGNDAKPFTRAETIAYISGKTQIWSQGGGYHAPDVIIDSDWGGTLYALWAGTPEVGTWSVTMDGQLCWHVPAWRSKSCAMYYHEGEDVYTKFKGTYEPADELQNGNTLDQL